MVFIFQFVNVLYHIDWFVDIKESLHSWDKAHLVMMYDLFNMLLDSVSREKTISLTSGAGKTGQPLVKG